MAKQLNDDTAIHEIKALEEGRHRAMIAGDTGSDDDKPSYGPQRMR